MRPCSYPPQVFGLAVVAVAVLTSSLRAQQGPPPAIRTAHGDWYWERGPADLVLEHGKIVTVDSAQPRAEALAIRGHRILAVGSDAAIARYVGPDTKVVDLQRPTGHSRLHRRARPLHGTGRIPQAAGPHGRPHLERHRGEGGRGGQEGRARRVDPRPAAGTRRSGSIPRIRTSRGYPSTPAWTRSARTTRCCWSTPAATPSFVNGKALELAGITDATPSPEGGEIVRDADGHAIGMLRDNAQGLVRRVYRRDLDRRTPDAGPRRTWPRRCGWPRTTRSPQGVTGFDDQGESFATIDFLKRQVAAGKVPIRLYVEVESMSPDSLARHLPDYWLVGYGDDHLTVRAVGEILSDGALGTHSAWFLKPYADLPSTSGLNVTPIARIRGEAEVALRNGFQVTVHAIGDRANREVLDTFQRIFAEHPEAKDLRWRIEHAQHLDPADIPRFGEMHVIASMQTLHACSDGPYVVTRLGEERAKAGAYAWRKLHGRGRHHRQWHRRPGGAAGPDPQLLLRGHAQAVEREALLPRRDDDP